MTLTLRTPWTMTRNPHPGRQAGASTHGCPRTRPVIPTTLEASTRHQGPAHSPILDPRTATWTDLEEVEVTAARVRQEAPWRPSSPPSSLSSSSPCSALGPGTSGRAGAGTAWGGATSHSRCEDNFVVTQNLPHGDLAVTPVMSSF